MSARVLVVALDAAEATLLERWSAEGRLPNLARLARASAVSQLDNRMDTLPGAIWPELNSGISVGRIGHFFTQDQLHTGEARWRPVAPEEAHPERFYWSEASRAGRRVAVVDMPHAAPAPDLNGIQLLDWGSHDRSRSFGFLADPPELLEELETTEEAHPVWDSDAYPARRGGRERLLAELHLGLDRRIPLLRKLLERERWDLFTCAFGECHSVGHQFWHFGDAGHPMHDPAAPQPLREGLAGIYEHVDAALGALVDAAGPDASVVLVASHGMGPLIGGPHLLPEVLVRLGMSSDRGAAAGSVLRRVQERAKERVAVRWVRLLQRVAGISWVRRLQEGVGGMVFPLQSPTTRACAIPNNRIGAIRLNVKGREPHGCIERGPELEALVAELREELLALEHLETGERIVADVVRVEDVFGPDHHPDLPDLFVRFRRDLGRLDGCRSVRVGVLRASAYHARSPRAGDHSAESRLWIRAPGVEAGAELPRGDVLDLAPTVLKLLGVPVPDDLDGRSLLGETRESGDAEEVSGAG